MPESSIEPVIPDLRSYGAAFSDGDDGLSGERTLPPQKVDHAALPNLNRVNLAPSSLRVGGSYTSLDLWYVDLDVPADSISEFRHWLSYEELGRAERFQSDLHRFRYIVGRGTLRCVLAKRLDCSPATIRFSYGANGKPTLADGQQHVEFNLAHSGREAIIAIADRAAVGVDIELLRPSGDVESLARPVFSDIELRELELAPDPVSAFLHGWTRKEAYVKALGLGLTAPLTEITVSLSDTPALLSTGLPDQPSSNWRLLNVPHPRAMVALALGPRLNRTRKASRRNYETPADNWQGPRHPGL